MAKKLFCPERIIISNPHTDKLKHPEALGVQVTCDNRAVVKASDLIILAVKPQMFEEVLSGIADCCAGKCMVSIAAGISSDWIRTRLPGAPCGTGYAQHPPSAWVGRHSCGADA